MARSATSSVGIGLRATIRNLLDDATYASSSVGSNSIISDSLVSGVSANEANRVWYIDDIAITSGNTRDIDIATMVGEDIGAGNGVDALGQSMDLEEIVLLAVKCSAGPGELEIMPTIPAAAPVAWIPQNYATNSTKGGIKAGGLRLWYEPATTGLDIGLGVSNVLRLGANGGDVTAEVFILGRHDDDESSSSSGSSSSSSTSSTT